MIDQRCNFYAQSNDTVTVKKECINCFVGNDLEKREYNKNRLTKKIVSDHRLGLYELTFNASNEALLECHYFHEPKYYFIPKLRIANDRINDDNYSYEENYYLEEISVEEYERKLNNRQDKQRKLFFK